MTRPWLSVSRRVAPAAAAIGVSAAIGTLSGYTVFAYFAGECLPEAAQVRRLRQVKCGKSVDTGGSRAQDQSGQAADCDQAQDDGEVISDGMSPPRGVCQVLTDPQ